MRPAVSGGEGAEGCEEATLNSSTMDCGEFMVIVVAVEMVSQAGTPTPLSLALEAIRE